MTTALTVLTGHRPDGAPSLTVAGEIDMSNADVFAAALADAVRHAGEVVLVVDLTGVQYLDSIGLAALFTHAERIALLVSPLLEPLLNVSGLTSRIV